MPLFVNKTEVNSAICGSYFDIIVHVYESLGYKQVKGISCSFHYSVKVKEPWIILKHPSCPERAGTRGKRPS